MVDYTPIFTKGFLMFIKLPSSEPTVQRVAQQALERKKKLEAKKVAAGATQSSHAQSARDWGRGHGFYGFEEMKTVICRSNHTSDSEIGPRVRSEKRLRAAPTPFLRVLWVRGNDTELRQLPQLFLMPENGAFTCRRSTRISIQRNQRKPVAHPLLRKKSRKTCQITQNQDL